MKPAPTRPKKKLLGVELMRGLAVFAVVLSHSGDGSWGEMPQSVIRLRAFFSFHVPFFLAISFYFLAQKYFQPEYLLTAKGLKARVQRIAIPYFAWSAIYMLIRTLFFFAEGNGNRLSKLYGDLPAIVFLGGASYHLYFLPLLLVGTLTFYGLKRSLKEWQLPTILILLGVSLGASLAILLTGNQFRLGPNIAFENVFAGLSMDPKANVLLRLLSVFIAWFPICLAYISVALLFNYIKLNHGYKITKSGQSYQTLLTNPYVALSASVFIFLVATFLGGGYLWIRPLQKLTVAFSLVLAAFSLSAVFYQDDSLLGKIAVSLGKCTLGIYLIHPVVLRFTRLGLSSVYPQLLKSVSVPSVLILASIGFLVSWALIIGLSKEKFIGKYLM